MGLYQIIALISLVLQFVILGLIIASLVMKRRKMIRAHGITMLLAVVVHSITILAVMIPSFSLGLTPYIRKFCKAHICNINFPWNQRTFGLALRYMDRCCIAFKSINTCVL